MARLQALRAFAPLLIGILLAGCGSIDNRAGVHRLPPEALSSAQGGVVLFSVGAPKSCMATSTFVSIHEAATGKRPKQPPIAVDAYISKSEFPDHHGLVNAVGLPAGKYYFAPSIANPYVQATHVPTFHFEVTAGETVYLGELFMTQSCALNTRFEVVDRFDRDVKIAIAKNPAMGGRVITPRLMQFRETLTRD